MPSDGNVTALSRMGQSAEVAGGARNSSGATALTSIVGRDARPADATVVVRGCAVCKKGPMGSVS